MAGRENSVETNVTTKLAPGKLHSSPCYNRSPTVGLLHKHLEKAFDQTLALLQRATYSTFASQLTMGT